MITTLSTVSTRSPLATKLRETADVWAKSQYELVVLAAEFADSGEWVLVGFDPGGSKPSPPFGAERRNARASVVVELESCRTRSTLAQRHTCSGQCA